MSVILCDVEDKCNTDNIVHTFEFNKIGTVTNITFKKLKSITNVRVTISNWYDTVESNLFRQKLFHNNINVILFSENKDIVLNCISGLKNGFNVPYDLTLIDVSIRSQHYIPLIDKQNNVCVHCNYIEEYLPLINGLCVVCSDNTE